VHILQPLATAAANPTVHRSFFAEIKIPVFLITFFRIEIPTSVVAPLTSILGHTRIIIGESDSIQGVHADFFEISGNH
jgi:hypothetical protein